jgi:hypothetical protein
MTKKNFKQQGIFKAGWSSITLAGMLFMTSPAWCGPPFVTDDPEPVEYHQHEMYIASEWVNAQDGKTFTPFIEYNYGALPDVQLSITVPYVFNTPVGKVKQQGFGDIVLGAKYRFFQETASLPMMAIYPVVVTTTGNANKGLGNGGPQIFLPLWIQKKWGKWQSYGGGGYWIDKAQGASNHWYSGAVLQYQISDRLTMGVDIFHEADQLEVETSSRGYSFGGIYSIDQHNRLLFSVGHAVEDESAQKRYFSYLAYGLSW